MELKYKDSLLSWKFCETNLAKKKTAATDYQSGFEWLFADWTECNMEHKSCISMATIHQLGVRYWSNLPIHRI
jgi:hypothetical protein